MLVGTIASVGNGASIPLLWFMFGNIAQSLTMSDIDLCKLDFNYISRMYCPENIHLTSNNFRQQYKYYY